MDPRFRIPVATMLGGLCVWRAFIGVRALTRGAVPGSPWMDAAWCVVAGALMVYSGFR
jgi:hypothetical protein